MLRAKALLLGQLVILVVVAPGAVCALLGVRLWGDTGVLLMLVPYGVYCVGVIALWTGEDILEDR